MDQHGIFQRSSAEKRTFLFIYGSSKFQRFACVSGGCSIISPGSADCSEAVVYHHAAFIRAGKLLVFDFIIKFERLFKIVFDTGTVGIRPHPEI